MCLKPGMNHTGFTMWLSGIHTRVLSHLWCVSPDAGQEEAAYAEWLHGRNCIELGAGTGIVGICAALLGAKVTLTDTASCLPLLQQNVEGHRNGIHCAGELLLACTILRMLAVKAWLRAMQQLCALLQVFNDVDRS